MDIEKIATCIKVLDEMSIAFGAMGADNINAAEAGLSCVIAQSIVVEYAAHRTDGLSHAEAMEFTALRQHSLNEASTSLMALLKREPE
jgi:hypothetical protein